MDKIIKDDNINSSNYINIHVNTDIISLIL